MQIEMSSDDALFLQEQLMRQLKRVEDELVHTEQRDLKRAVADDARRLRALIDRLTPV